MPAHDPIQILRERFGAAIRAAFGESLKGAVDPLIAAARNPEFGDFQSNAAMPLAKQLGAAPRDVAARIVAELDLAGVAEPVDESSIAGPGFINIRLSRDALAGFLSELDSPTLGVDPPAERKTVVVDLCGVNLAKQMHVGHLRATVIGDALARVFERLGHTVRRQNHFGDWGLPIAMVTDKVMQLDKAGVLDTGALTLDALDTLYRTAQGDCAADRKGLEAVNRFDLGPKARAELEAQVAGAAESLERAKGTLVKLQAGDPETVRYWKLIYDITIDACLKVCARLHADVQREHTAGESTYRDELPEIVHDLESRGVAVESQGALVVKLEEFGVKEPLLIRKSDGGFLYATTDLAGIRRRVQKLGGDELVYAVDARQSLHFKQAFAAATKAGYAKRPNGEDAILKHAAFGTVLGADGRPFRTRSGENVKLVDLLDEAVQRASIAVREKNPDLSEEAQREVAEAVGVGAIKHADLSSERIKDYVFDFDRMLAFEGDTGPYLQYALVRVRSIFRKGREEFGVDEARFDADPPPFLLDAPEEKALALELLRYPGVLHAVADALEPHRLCAALYAIATAFSRFFQSCPVLRAPDEPTRLSRLRLCRLTGRVLEDGLNTLGIVPLERM